MDTTGTEGGGVKERVGVAIMGLVVSGAAARLLCSVAVVMAVDHHFNDLDFWM